MFQTMLIRTSGLLPLLGEELAPPPRPAHSLMGLCRARVGSPLTWAAVSGQKAGPRGMRRAQGLAWGAPVLPCVLWGMFANVGQPG